MKFFFFTWLAFMVAIALIGWIFLKCHHPFLAGLWVGTATFTVTVLAVVAVALGDIKK